MAAPGVLVRVALGVLAILVAHPTRAGRSEDPNKIVSPLNRRSLSLSKRPDRYAFFLIGHLYGSQNQSIYPSASVLANLDRFDRRDLRFGVLLGDLVRAPTDLQIDAFDRTFAALVRKPLFAVMGNHDEGRDRGFQRRYGDETYYAFRHASEHFVFLDGELDDGDITGPQLEFLQRQVERSAHDASVRNLFVFCHRLVWAIGNPPLDALLPYVNGPESHRADAVSFTRDVLPRLRTLGKPVFLISGDVGGGWSFPFLFERDAEGDITYIATGIGDTVEDTMLVASVDRGEVSFTPVSLGGHEVIAPPLDRYGVSYWRVEMIKRRASQGWR